MKKTRHLTLLVASALILLVTSLAAGAAAPIGRYTIGADTVVDAKTHLTWQRNLPTGTYTWANAKSYCQGLGTQAFAGSSTWRLPTKKELASLIDISTSSPSIDTVAFPGTPNQLTWTSTAWADDYGQGLSGYYWAVDFSYGTYTFRDPTGAWSVRCVY